MTSYFFSSPIIKKADIPSIKIKPEMLGFNGKIDTPNAKAHVDTPNAKTHVDTTTAKAAKIRAAETAALLAKETQLEKIGKTKFKIYEGTKCNILNYSMYPDEFEVLIQRNYRYLITDVMRQNTAWVLKLTIIPDDI